MNDDISGGTSTNERSDGDFVKSGSGNGNLETVARGTDVHPTDAAFWTNARVVLPRRKETVTIRLDADLLEWLRQQRGYQTRINAVLRAYMDAGGSGGGSKAGKVDGPERPA